MHRVVRILMSAIGGSLLLASASFAQPPADAELPPTRMNTFMASGGPCCGDAPYCRNWWAVGPAAPHLRWQGHCGGDCNFQNETGGCCDNRGHSWFDRLLGRCGSSCDSCCDPYERACRVRGCSNGCNCSQCNSCESKGCDRKPVGCDTRPDCGAKSPVDREVNPFRDDPSTPPMPTTPKPLSPEATPAKPMLPKIPEPDLNSASKPPRGVVTASFVSQAGRNPRGTALLDARGVPAQVQVSTDELAQPTAIAKPATPAVRTPAGTSLRIREVRDIER